MAIRVRILFIILYIKTLCDYNVTCAKKSNRKSYDSSIEDELFPIYECDERSRDWTLRCLVPLTNAQMSLDLCKTGENPDQQFLHRCAKELQILGQSCPQPVAVADIARNMQAHKPPPMPYESPNHPKVPKPPSAGNMKDKFSL
uniref:Proline rich salivary secreted peptide n=1 Tax=Anopheles minimus TaxID=112268 RepID=A0A182WLW5_9DIPT